jgi:hypothetical protein
VIELLIGPVSSLLDKFIPDADERNRLAHQIATMSERHAHEVNKAQMEINKTEAAHKSLFVAGWRPALGWTFALGIAGNYILIPMANFALALSDSPITIPLIDLETMMPVLIGMLGLGGMRTLEKTKGVQREK